MHKYDNEINFTGILISRIALGLEYILGNKKNKVEYVLIGAY